jgi:hypothetical protein
MKTLYEKRDLESLWVLYMQHLRHMTSEALHEKAEIAAELAYRDSVILKLQKELADLQSGKT